MKPVIMIAQRIGGENGGPFVSHKRIMESRLREKYEFIPLQVPRARVLLMPWNMLRFAKQIRIQKPHLVQIAGLQLEGFLPMIACKLAGVKTVLAIHGSLMEAETITGIRRSIYSCIEKITVKLADGVFGVSNYVSSWPVCKFAKRYYGTIYNLISEKREISQRDLHVELGIPHDATVVVSTGRITIEKGYADLWRVIQGIQHLGEVHFVIAGDGDYRPEFEKEVKEKGYSANVHLLGYLKDVSSVLKIADIFVICTHHETLCISILEACSYALPVVATDVGGIPEIVEDGVSGYLVKRGDIAGFVSAIDKLVSSPEAREDMGKISCEKLTSMFDTKAILDKIDSMYSELRKR